MDLSCKPRYASNPRPEVVILVNGEEVGTNRYTLRVTEEHFNSERSWGGYRNRVKTYKRKLAHFIPLTYNLS